MSENEAEKILCQSEEWLRLAVQAGKMYAYEWDVTTDVLVRSPESLLVKHQLRDLNRGRRRAPNLRAGERFITGLCTVLMNPARVCTNLWNLSGRATSARISP